MVRRYLTGIALIVALAGCYPATAHAGPLNRVRCLIPEGCHTHSS